MTHPELLKALRESVEEMGRVHGFPPAKMGDMLRVVARFEAEYADSFDNCKVWRNHWWSRLRQRLPWQVELTLPLILIDKVSPPPLPGLPAKTFRVLIYDPAKVKEIKDWISYNTRGEAWLILAPIGDKFKRTRALFRRQTDAALFKLFWSE